MSATTTGDQSEARLESRVRRAHLGLVSGTCVLAALACVGVALFAAGDLPTTMATHFGPSGQADRFTDTRWALLLQTLVTVGVPLALFVVLRAGEWWRGEFARSTSAFVVGLTGGLTTLFVKLTLAHVGVQDPAQVTTGLSTLLLILGVLLGTWVLAWLLLPQPLPRPPAHAVIPVQVSASERVSWFGRAHMNQVAMVALIVATAVMFLAAIATAVWWLLLVGVGMIVLVLGVTSFTVTVDSGGVTWRSALGVPRGSVPLKNIREASVVEVRPGDFGGYGLRTLPGRLGIITRSGPALRVERERGVLVITVDDALTAAGVIEGLRAARIPA